MHDTTIADRLVETFSRDYFEKLFYFCLKRTGNPTEAEELTSEVSLAILTALRSGTIPQHFSAWVWQIARNCYSHWAERKHRRAETVSGTDLEDFADIASEESVEERVIHSEELKLLRRELAFISADYRDVIVAFYIEDRKVSDIAKSLHLSEGTVKSKLFRSRNILKEGMNMAREFGSKSYKPENIGFNIQYAAPQQDMARFDKLLEAFGRSIVKNILLEASNNPSTMEELSIELGVAMPYMEDEVKHLIELDLLKPIKDKYITNFFIQDKECQLTLYELFQKNTTQRSLKLYEVVAASLPAIRDKGIGDNLSDEDLIYWLLLHTVDMLADRVDGRYDYFSNTSLANGGTWYITGYENTTLPENLHCGYGGKSVEFPDFRYDLWGWDLGLSGRLDRFSDNEILLLAEILKKHHKISDLSFAEINTWEKIDNKLAHADGDGNVVPDLLVLYPGQMDEIDNVILAHPGFQLALNDVQKLYDQLIALLQISSNGALHNKLAYYATYELWNLRMCTVRDVINAGKLTVPEDGENSNIAMSLSIS